MCENCQEINDVLGNAVDSLNAERQKYERDREVMALAMIEIGRLGESIVSIVDRTTSKLVGIDPKGRPVI